MYLKKLIAITFLSIAVIAGIYGITQEPSILCSFGLICINSACTFIGIRFIIAASDKEEIIHDAFSSLHIGLTLLIFGSFLRISILPTTENHIEISGINIISITIIGIGMIFLAIATYYFIRNALES